MGLVVTGFLLWGVYVVSAVVRMINGSVKETDPATWIMGLMFCGGGGALLIYFGLKKNRSVNSLKFLEENVPAYLGPPAPGPSSAAPSVRGTLVPVNRQVHLECSSYIKANSVNEDVYGKLPEALRAGRAHPPGTVALMDWMERTVGRYEGGEPACVMRCLLTLVDLSVPAVIHWHEFVWRPPEVLELVDGKRVCPDWEGEVAAYLKSLPRA